VVALAGVARLTWAMRRETGSQMVSQCVLAANLVLLLVITYDAPTTLGIFILALLVTMFSEMHIRAWVAETIGPKATLEQGRELVRRRGPARYAGVAAIQPALQLALGLVVLAESTSPTSWEHWLGLGIAVGALLQYVMFALSIWRVQRAVDAGAARGPHDNEMKLTSTDG
jgi:hypothetical protein